MEGQVKNITNAVVGGCIILCLFQHAWNDSLFYPIDAITTCALLLNFYLVAKIPTAKFMLGVVLLMFLYYGFEYKDPSLDHFADANECLLLFGIYISTCSEVALLCLFILIGKFVTGFSSPYAFSFLEFIDLSFISFVTFEKYKHKIFEVY